MKGILFVSPWLIGFAVFTLIPFINSILYSFNAVSITPGKINLKWAGLEYYNQAWNVSTSFKLNLSSSAMMICCATPVILVFALIVAVMLNNKFRGRVFFRAIFFMPVIIMSGPVISKLLTGYTVNFTEEGSQIMLFLQSLPGVISKPCVFVLDNLVLILWFSGVQILIYLAGLQKVSTSLYEAAEIDGANKFQTLYKIIIPMTMPSVTICLFLTLTNCFKLFDQNLALTAGGPAKKTAMLAYDIYTTFYNRNGWEGVGQAKAVIFFIIVAAISLTQLYFTRRKEVEN